MTPERAREILSADVCHPEREPGDAPGPTHLVVPDSGRRVCDGRTMVAPVLADSEVPTCRRCDTAGRAANRYAREHEVAW